MTAESLALRSCALAADAHLRTAIAALDKALQLVDKLAAPQITNPVLSAIAGAKLAKERLAIISKRIP